MDKAKAMELANKILNANKKDASFFDFINEQFQDDSAYNPCFCFCRHNFVYVW